MIIKCTVNAKLSINFVHLCNEELNFFIVLHLYLNSGRQNSPKMTVNSQQ